MSEIRCFMVHLGNERLEPCTWDHPADSAGCPGHSRFDLLRSADGAVLVPDVHHIYHAGPKAPPPGSMWWYQIGAADDITPGGRLFFAGAHLLVMTPDGPWNIDGRATNCPLPDDLDHRCWVRHGRPPVITVDKVGQTCAAGSGSIRVGDYHGFLVGGVLRAA